MSKTFGICQEANYIAAKEEGEKEKKASHEKHFHGSRSNPDHLAGDDSGEDNLQRIADCKKPRPSFPVSHGSKKRSANISKFTFKNISEEAVMVITFNALSLLFQFEMDAIILLSLRYLHSEFQFCPHVLFPASPRNSCTFFPDSIFDQG